MKTIYLKLSENSRKNYINKYIIKRGETLNYILLVDSTGEYNIKLDFILQGIDSYCYIYILEIGYSDNGTIHKLDLEIESIHKSHDTNAKTIIRRVMYDNSKSYITGLIRIEREAQHSFDYFDEKTLLLSDNVISKVVPALEILPDNVKASHNSAMAEINDNEIFYLESRGLDRNIAENLIASGFLKSPLSLIRNNNVYDKIMLDIDKRFLTIL
ncbi:MAG: SufD family Fe-S cluster assembly protein [Patescibacteria group bacterium]